MIEVPVSWGELIDKITILEIKSERITDLGKLANVRRELDLLTQKAGPRLAEAEALADALRRVNLALWVAEDEIRSCENEGDFGRRFIELARSIYRTNDLRSDLKRRLNLALGSDIIEEKSYQPYTAN